MQDMHTKVHTDLHATHLVVSHLPKLKWLWEFLKFSNIKFYDTPYKLKTDLYTPFSSNSPKGAYHTTCIYWGKNSSVQMRCPKIKICILKSVHYKGIWCEPLQRKTSKLFFWLLPTLVESSNPQHASKHVDRSQISSDIRQATRGYPTDIYYAR